MISIGSDHGGINLKTLIIDYFKKNSIEFKDFGSYDNKSVDYPDYAKVVAESIISGESTKGILICGTGIGISIAANKFKGIRAALCTDTYMAKMSREHNDSNILAMGGKVVGEGVAIDILEVWLKSEFLGDRHTKRLEKIKEIENFCCNK